MSVQTVVPWTYSVPCQQVIGPVTGLALEYGNLEMRRVQDADSLPMLAVLFLPALLSLFRLACFLEASLPATVAYEVATDILSVFPMAIRGVELIVYGSRKYYSHSTDVEGLWNDDDIVVAVTFAARCGIKHFVKRTGGILLAIAFVVMLLGIVLEYLSRCMTARQRCDRKRVWTGQVMVEETDSGKSFKMCQKLLARDAGNQFTQSAMNTPRNVWPVHLRRPVSHLHNNSENPAQLECPTYGVDGLPHQS